MNGQFLIIRIYFYLIKYNIKVTISLLSGHIKIIAMIYYYGYFTFEEGNSISLTVFLISMNVSVF